VIAATPPRLRPSPRPAQQAGPPQRHVPLRVRPDLTAQQHCYEGRISWIVKDPLALQYYRFQEEEYALLQMLDGRTSLQQLKQQFEQQFPGQQLTLEELQQFVASLHASGLLLADAPGQAEVLHARALRKKRQERAALAFNLLAIRFRGFDPTKLLDTLYPAVRWMFSPLAVLAGFVLMAAALTLLTVEFDTFLRRLPAFHQFFSPEGAFWVLVALAGSKVVHELGHGLTCRHFGGRCHEMGVMLLVLAPCLYCNVSDSWMLPSKWRRAAIGAAGMYVELVLASICTFLWWFSEPGLFHHLCLSLMFVCSVNTLLFNANPLLRFDAYYILSDLIEVPNLRQKSSTLLNRWLRQVCLGIEPADDPFLPTRRRGLIATYTVAAAIYRWVVMFAIVWFLTKVFEPYRLEVLGYLLAAVAIAGLVVMPVVSVVRFFWVPGRLEKVNPMRVKVSLAALILVAAALCLIPLPYRVACSLEIEPYQAAAVYVDTPGTLSAIEVRPGQQVQPGDVIARLESTEIDSAIAELSGKREVLARRLDSLRRERYGQAEVARQIPEVEKALAALDRQLEQKRAERQRLTLLAPRAGMILPPPSRHQRPDPDGRLPEWDGTPLEERNLGCYATPGVLVCQVGDPAELEAVLVIEQGQIEFVREGQEVQIVLDELPHDVLTGTIAEIASLDLKSTPLSLSNKAGGDLATITDEAGIERPQQVSYQARVRLHDPEGIIRPGMRGRAKIHTQGRTLAWRAQRYLSETFRFRR